MTPIERVRAKDAARAVLGVRSSADAAEIRAAWRRAAFAAHPDRHGGDQRGFVQAKAAYDLLSAQFEIEEGQSAHRETTRAETRQSEGAPRTAAHPARHTARRAPGTASGPAPQRPRLAERETPLAEAATIACRALLAQEEPAPRAAHLRLHAEAETQAGGATVDHVPHALRRRGRAVTFVLRGRLAAGLNRVALPAGVLEGADCPRPQVVAISAAREAAGEVVVPDRVRARLFPGARQVRLRFDGS